MKDSKRAKAAPLAARRAYPRLTLDDRRGIERGLDGGESMREIARMLGRPPSTVTREVRRNRVYLRPGGMEGERFPAEGPDGPCGLLARSPGVCSGCRKRACGCSRTPKAVYRAARAHALADEELRGARRGVDETEEGMAMKLEVIRSDLARGRARAGRPARAARGGRRAQGVRRRAHRQRPRVRRRGRHRRRSLRAPGRDEAVLLRPDASDQKGACERDRVEIRKLLPKGRGISFDWLAPADRALPTGQVNSEPRGSLAFMCPSRMLPAAYGDDARALLDGLGIEVLDPSELDLTPGCIERARAERGDGPLAG